MKKQINRSFLLWLVFAIGAIAAAVMQTIGVMIAYGPDTNYFQADSPLPILAVIFSLISAVAGTLAAMTTKPSTLAAAPFGNRSYPTPAAFGFLFAAIVILLFNHNQLNPTVGTLAALFLALAVLYAILIGFPIAKAKASIVALLGFLAVIACILLTAYYYFDTSIEMNAPLKTATQTGILFSLILYTEEIRYLLDRARPRFYLSVCTWVVSIGALSTPAMLVGFLTDRIDRADYTAGAFLILCIMVTALIRIHTLLHPQVPTTPDSEPTQSPE